MHSPLMPGPRNIDPGAQTLDRQTPACNATHDPCPARSSNRPRPSTTFHTPATLTFHGLPRRRCPTRRNGVCDYLTCGCDYADCGGDAMPYDFGPAVWNWKVGAFHELRRTSLTFRDRLRTSVTFPDLP